jgi:NADH-quinone oxidoreductase subunit E
MAYIFNDTQMTEFKRLVARYPEGKQKSALLPVLHLAQESFNGWLPTEALDYVASLLQIEPIEVFKASGQIRF